MTNFEEFVKQNEKRIKAGLVAAYGPTLGLDCAAEAMAYAWENWPKVQAMDNPSGYLYRVGRTFALRSLKPSGYLPAKPSEGMPYFEPDLAPALESLSEPQRVAVVLVHSLGWPLKDAAEVLDVSVSTLRTHIKRALGKLRTSLKVESNAS